MPKDDLDTLIDDLDADDPGLRDRVAAAIGRREFLRHLAEERRRLGLTQVELARRMHTSQAQITRLESGADTRLSTVERYAAAIGARVTWHLETGVAAESA